jgi:hypothetical protein
MPVADEIVRTVQEAELASKSDALRRKAADLEKRMAAIEQSRLEAETKKIDVVAVMGIVAIMLLAVAVLGVGAYVLWSMDPNCTENAHAHLDACNRSATDVDSIEACTQQYATVRASCEGVTP